MDKKISLEEMLIAREQRARKQQELIETYKSTLISYTMNIAGPVKNSFFISQCFRYGLELILEQLQRLNIKVLFKTASFSDTGCEAFIAVDSDPMQIKTIAVDIEDGAAGGRLFDIDVIDKDFNHIDRSTLGYENRRCLICQRNAKECARSRTHSLVELEEKTQFILKESFTDCFSGEIASLALRSILYESCVTPKPGLVDCHDNGSHKDMNIFTFMNSSSVLSDFFKKCAEIGIKTADARHEITFRELQKQGRIAEGQMLKSTQGVNTHKGAIFLLGLLCGAAGRLYKEGFDKPENLGSECALLTKGLSEKALVLAKEKAMQDGTTKNLSHGEKILLEYGIKGARGQAENGLKTAIEVGLPAIENGFKKGFDENLTGALALLSIIANESDTNIISRGGFEKAQEIQKRLREMLRDNSFPTKTEIEKLNEEFIKDNLSPGGSADLLAVSFFFFFLKTRKTGEA